MSYETDALKSAHRHSATHRKEVEASAVCGCFYCCEVFSPSEIGEWLEELDGTALCPRCGIDSVIGSASGYPVADKAFLRAMHGLWFS
jgi:hypothetical protein